jgi:putative peptidoglycan lipid II flippase
VFGMKLAIALACMGAALWLSAGDLAWWTDAAMSARAARLTGIVVLGATTYFFALWLLGFRVADFSRRTTQ